jgi:hypothetical protein
VFEEEERELWCVQSEVLEDGLEAYCCFDEVEIVLLAKARREAFWKSLGGRELGLRGNSLALKGKTDFSWSIFLGNLR